MVKNWKVNCEMPLDLELLNGCLYDENLISDHIKYSIANRLTDEILMMYGDKISELPTYYKRYTHGLSLYVIHPDDLKDFIATVLSTNPKLDK